MDLAALLERTNEIAPDFAEGSNSLSWLVLPNLNWN
jgi:hypothetical protein